MEFTIRKRLVVFFTFATLLGASEANAGGSRIIVKPGTLNFGKAIVLGTLGVPTIGKVTITNSKAAGAAVKILGIASDRAEFVPATTCMMTTLKPGDRCVFTVTFTPDAPGAFHAKLTIDTDSGAPSRSVTLKGSGVQGKLSFSPKSIDFGRVSVGTSSVAPPITLINKNRIGMSVGPFMFSDPQFSETDNCNGMLGANGGACQLTVTVKPTSPGHLKAAMNINNGASGSPQQVGLKALAVLPHVFIVVEENHGFSEVIGDPNMSYIGANSGTSLQQVYGLATNYYADTHPSIGNYFVMTSGVDISRDDGLTPDACGHRCNLPNIFRSLTENQISWKVYAEDLPSIGYTGDNTDGYAVRRDPAAYFAVNDPVVRPKVGNIVPFADPNVGLAADLAKDTLPTFAFVEPNAQHDQHDGTDAQADQWLQTNIDPLIKSPKFGDGLLIVWWDEGDSNDCSSTVSKGCGGRVALILASRAVKSGYRGGRYYRHGGTLRLMYDALGLGTAPGSGAHSNSMSDFFGG